MNFLTAQVHYTVMEISIRSWFMFSPSNLSRGALSVLKLCINVNCNIAMHLACYTVLRYARTKLSHRVVGSARSALEQDPTIWQFTHGLSKVYKACRPRISWHSQGKCFFVLSGEGDKQLQTSRGAMKRKWRHQSIWRLRFCGHPLSLVVYFLSFKTYPSVLFWFVNPALQLQ